MKKLFFTLFLVTLSLVGEAQIIKSNSVKTNVKVESLSDGKKDWFYIGAGYGPAWYEDYYYDSWAGYSIKEEYTELPLMLEFNYMRAISGTFDYSVVPYFGGGAALGIGTEDGNFYGHLQPFLGVMLGGPSFRFDIRAAPTLYMVDDDWYGSLLFEPGVWFNHFYFGFGIGFEFDDMEACGMIRTGWSF